jgi:hypothetical protein
LDANNFKRSGFMAVIVKHIESGEKFILLGTGFGAFKATRPSLFFGNLAPTEEAGQVTMVAVCNSQGQIGWIHSDELQVVEVDGKAPAELL